MRVELDVIHALRLRASTTLVASELLCNIIIPIITDLPLNQLLTGSCYSHQIKLYITFSAPFTTHADLHHLENVTTRKLQTSTGHAGPPITFHSAHPKPPILHQHHWPSGLLAPLPCHNRRFHLRAPKRSAATLEVQPVQSRHHLRPRPGFARGDGPTEHSRKHMRAFQEGCALPIVEG